MGQVLCRHILLIARCVLVSLVLACLFPNPSLAHRVGLFAWVDGAYIKGESKFSNGKPAKDAKIFVSLLASKTLVTTTTTDREGLFSVKIPEKAKEEGVILQVDAGEGHQNSWEMEASEFGGMAQNVEMRSDSQEVSGAQDVSSLRNIIREELAPIKRELAKAKEHTPGLIEIIGGIGWLIGLAAIGQAWINKRKG